MTHARTLGTWSLTLLTVAALANLRNLPLMAVEGMRGIVFYLIAAVLFFLPTTLICAALASRWPLSGGLYRWVALAFGPRWGFMTIWLSWLITLAFLPSVLAYLAGIYIEIFLPAYQGNMGVMLATMGVILWSVTVLNYSGALISTWFSMVALVIGTLVPGLLIIAGGAYWYWAGWPLQLDLTPGSWMPTASWEQLVILVGAMLAFEGAELSAFHAESVHHPRKTYPRALFLAAFILLTFSVLGSLSIAAVLPAGEISLVHGIMQSMTAFFAAFNIPVGAKVVGFAILLGGIAGLCVWIGGPITGILASARDGFFPARFQKRNAHDAPVALLNLQAVIISALVLIGNVLLPDIEYFYWASTVLAAQSAFLSYAILFAAALVLKWQYPPHPDSYQIPGGKIGTCIVVGMGMLGCTVGFLLGFTPPPFLEGAPIGYGVIVFIGLAALVSPALYLCYRFKGSGAL